jgi:hypothetical protein
MCNATKIATVTPARGASDALALLSGHEVGIAIDLLYFVRRFGPSSNTSS